MRWFGQRHIHIYEFNMFIQFAEHYQTHEKKLILFCKTCNKSIEIPIDEEAFEFLSTVKRKKK